jgi:hypothetical protein
MLGGRKRKRSSCMAWRSNQIERSPKNQANRPITQRQKVKHPPLPYSEAPTTRLQRSGAPWQGTRTLPSKAYRKKGCETELASAQLLTTLSKANRVNDAVEKNMIKWYIVIRAQGHNYPKIELVFWVVPEFEQWPKITHFSTSSRTFSFLHLYSFTRRPNCKRI